MRPVIFAILSIYALMCLPALADEDNIEYWLREGFSDYQNESYETAISSFDRAIKIDQNNATAWIGKGIALSSLERYEEAVASYNQSLDIDNQNVDAWYFRGETLGALGRYEEALQSFDKSIEIDPNSTSAWYGRAMALKSLGRSEESDEAMSIYKDLAYAHISFSNNSGESMEDAIVIMNAIGEDDGVGSEYYYLEKRFGRDGVYWDNISQSLVEDEKGQSYDVLDVPLTTGETITVYFNITDFFGKGFEELLKELGLG